MKDQLSICIVLPHIYALLSGSRDIKLVGGAEMRHANAAKYLAHTGYKVSVVCLDYDQPDGEIIDGVQVFKSHRPEGGIPVLKFFYSTLFKTWQAMKRANADIYYQPCAGYLTGVVAAFCHLYGRKSVFAGASDTDFIPGKLRLGSAWEKVMYLWGLRHVDAIVVQSLKQQQLCIQNFKMDANLIPNGYSLPYQPGQNKKEYVLWVGNMREVKRPDRVLDIARKMPHLKFRMIGGQMTDTKDGGVYFQSIKRAAEDLHNLEFLGFLPYEEAEKHFDDASILLNTSDIEGFPNTFLQAWSRGIPTVSFFNAILNEESVYLNVASTEDAVHAIKTVLADEIVWNNYSNKSMSYFSRVHDMPNVIRRYSELINECINHAC